MFRKQPLNSGRPFPAPVAVLDLETTGFWAEGTDRVLEIAVVLLDSSGREEARFESLVNPRRDPGPSRIHGIRAADLVDAPEFGDIAGHVFQMLDGRVLASHNLSFDLRFLEAECRRIGERIPVPAGLCTLSYARRVISAPNYRLATLCQTCRIPYEHHHAASADAEAAARLLVYLWNHRPDPAKFPARGPSWPSRPPAASPVPRGAARRAPRPVLAQLLDRVEAASSPDQPCEDDYIELLSRAIEDRIVTENEAAALRTFAAETGLTQGALDRIHQQFFRNLVRLAWSDGRLTGVEREDLSRIAALFGFAPEMVEQFIREEAAAPRGHAAPKSPGSSSLQGLTVCFTGESKLSIDGAPLTRELARALAANAGLTVSDSVTRKVDLLVCADPHSQSGKARRARELGVRVMAEEEFWSRLGIPLE